MTQCADADFARFAEAVPSYLRYQDAQIGELLEAAGRDTVTVLVSDHGFKAGSRRPKDIAPYTTGMPAEWHRAWGVLLLHGPGIRQGTLPRASVYDVAPTLLYLSGLPLAEDMPGRPVLAAFTRPQPAAQIRSYELVGKPLARDRAAPRDRTSGSGPKSEMARCSRRGAASSMGSSPGPSDVGRSSSAAACDSDRAAAACDWAWRSEASARIGCAFAKMDPKMPCCVRFPRRSQASSAVANRINGREAIAWHDHRPRLSLPWKRGELLYPFSL